MDIEQYTKLLEAIATLIQAFGWPLLVLFLVLYLGRPLKKFIGDVGEFTFKAGASGLEATARKQLEAAASLGAAVAGKTGDTVKEKTLQHEDKARDIADLVSQVINPREIRRLSQTSILWVDDNPFKNVRERRLFESLGMRVSISTSTEDALEKIRVYNYDVIISDMGRPPDSHAGYTLLAEKKKMGNETPYIIYAGSNAPEHKAEARKNGAIGSTNDPQELFQLVVNAIQSDKN